MKKSIVIILPVVKCSNDTTFAKGGQSLWTAKIIAQLAQNARREDSTSEWLNVVPSKPSNSMASERVPLPERLGVFHPLLQTNCIEVHRPARAVREKTPVILRNLDRRSTKPIEQPAIGNRKQTAAGTSPSGWFGRCGNTSSLWMPAVATPSCTTYLSPLRWFVPEPSTT